VQIRAGFIFILTTDRPTFEVRLGSSSFPIYALKIADLTDFLT
jgi:hypothetical protein